MCGSVMSIRIQIFLKNAFGFSHVPLLMPKTVGLGIASSGFMFLCSGLE